MIKIFQTSIELEKIILPIVYVIIGIIIYKILQNFLYKSRKNLKTKLKTSQYQRVKTTQILILNIIKYIIIFIVVLAIFSTFGINISSILAGLGITTAILGLALQDFAKDIIAGISIITEGQYEVGNTIEVDGFMGEVVYLGLKTTRIKNFKGAVKIIANHNMDKIINYSLNNSLAVIDVSTGYDHDPEQIEKSLNALSERLKGKIEYATSEMKILGITDLGDSGVIYRVTVEVEPMQHFVVERFLRKEIKKAFDKDKIKIPYTQIEVHHGNK